MLWSVVSKATLRSYRTNTETKLLVEAIRSLFVISDDVVFSAMVFSKTRVKVYI